MSQQQMFLFVIGVTCEPLFIPQRFHATKYAKENETNTYSFTASSCEHAGSK